MLALEIRSDSRCNPFLDANYTAVLNCSKKTLGRSSKSNGVPRFSHQTTRQMEVHTLTSRHHGRISASNGHALFSLFFIVNLFFVAVRFWWQERYRRRWIMCCRSCIPRLKNRSLNAVAGPSNIVSWHIHSSTGLVCVINVHIILGQSHLRFHHIRP